MPFNLFENELVRSMMFGKVDQAKLPQQIHDLYQQVSREKDFHIQDLAGLVSFAPPEIQSLLQPYLDGSIDQDSAAPPASGVFPVEAVPPAPVARRSPAPTAIPPPSKVSGGPQIIGEPGVSKPVLGKRKYHNKSRKGCSTCKKRRVKCDEGRPACGKCEHMGIACGYGDTDDGSASTNALPLSEPPRAPAAAKTAPVFFLPFDGAASKLTETISLMAHPLTNLPDPVQATMAGTNHLQVPTASVPTPATASVPTPAIAQATTPAATPYIAPSIAPAFTVSNMGSHSRQPSIGEAPRSPSNPGNGGYSGPMNMVDLRLMYHYTTQVWPTITAAGILEEKIWSTDIPELAFHYPFLMHSILAFSATHLSRTEKGLESTVTCHRGDALRLLGEAVLEMSVENTDALVASALILIMDALANASLPTFSSRKSMPASAWIFHVKGAATILTAVWPLSEVSRFYKFISVDLGDLGDIMNLGSSDRDSFTGLQCFDEEIADMYPVPTASPYLLTLAYMNKLHLERHKSDFILRVFAFPALLDKSFLAMLMTGDLKAMRIMRSYYKLLRSFTSEMKDRVWFLEGLSNVLPVNVEEYAGGGGLHMMLDFLGSGAVREEEIEEEEWEIPEVD